jgi:integrase
MRVLFNAAMRWELISYQLNPMSLERVKDGSKRKREPKPLSAEEFRQMLEHVPEPFRTMCLIAMCMGLRVSEILGPKWCDIDWEGMEWAYASRMLRDNRRRENASFPAMDAT